MDERPPDWKKPALIAVLLALYAWALAHPVTLVTSDLGRHLRNGEAVWNGAPGALTSNFYSFTEPARPVLNHHWGSGLVFYLAWRVGGFLGLHLFFLAVCLGALFFSLRLALGESPPSVVAAAGLLFLPLLAQRAEIRPEAFSGLLGAVFLDRLWRYERGRLPAKSLWVLPLLEALWVNLHIYFVLGLALIGALLVSELLRADRRPRAARTALLLGASAAAALINPFGIGGLAEPFTIGRDYGYRLLENQSVWFLQRMFGWPVLALFEAALAGLALAFALAWRRKGADWFRLLVAAGLSAMACLAYRNFALFALFCWPIAAAELREALPAGLAEGPAALAVPAAALCALAAASLRWALLGPPADRGLGLRAGDSAAADFIRATGLTGPIFNDYDIGGYLIFHLFPGERVFVDNRPEAYSGKFFESVYVPMQENDRVWAEQSKRFGFNAIVFSWRDATPWGQAFLIRRIQDSAWAPVFVDGGVLVLASRSKKNRALIARFELPRSMFRIAKGVRP